MAKKRPKRGRPTPADVHAVDRAVVPSCVPFGHDAWSAICDELDLRGKVKQTAELVLKGCRDRNIATEMGISPHTVRSYLRLLFERAGVKSRVEFIVLIFTKAQEHCFCDSSKGNANHRPP